MASDSNPRDKLSDYSLKFRTASQKFDEALQLQKSFMKAVSKMRYEFHRSLSVNQKKLLDQDRFRLVFHQWLNHAIYLNLSHKQNPKNILNTTRHYHAKRSLFALKVKQYRLLAGPNANEPETQLKAAQLAREAVAFDNKYSKYLRYPPAI